MLGYKRAADWDSALLRGDSEIDFTLAGILSH